MTDNPAQAAPGYDNGEAATATEQRLFKAWATDYWPNSSPPHNAWIGWRARARLNAAPSPAPTARAQAAAEEVAELFHDGDLERAGGE